MLAIWKTIRNFAAEMNKNLYIISGCNGAGKTTASYTVLPEVLDCIPEPIVRRRYIAGISNLFRLFMIEVDSWEIYDNSVFPAVQIAAGGKGDEVSIFVESTYNKIADYVK